MAEEARGRPLLTQSRHSARAIRLLPIPSGQASISRVGTAGMLCSHSPLLHCARYGVGWPVLRKSRRHGGHILKASGSNMLHVVVMSVPQCCHRPRRIS